MKTKTVSFNLVAIRFPFGLQKKKNFLIPLIGLNWSVCFDNFFCWVTREARFQQSGKHHSVQSRTQRLRSRPLIQTMIPGFLKLMIFRIGTFEYSPEVAKEVLLSHWSGKVNVFKNLKRPTCGEDRLDRLLRHYMTGIRLSCNHCNKKFKHLNSLNNHHKYFHKITG